ncbi:2-nitropropane dioxygenase [Mycena floridula]|nr:2-nitropropane dioxygenase [Mycena floridula]
MSELLTQLTQLLNLKSPIIAGPMYYASTPDLAAAVSVAGGLGMIAAGFSSSKQLTKELRSIRKSLDLSNDVPIPIGVGLLGWILDKTEISDDPRIPAVLSQMPTTIWFAFGNDLGKYVAQVREYDARRNHKTVVFVVVNSDAEAVRAWKEWKVDVIVVQGIEAGGHSGAAAPPLINLLQEVLAVIPSDGPLIVGAGGITTGKDIARILALGAHGVVLGTRFLYTHECMYPDAYKQVLVNSGPNSTTRGLIFDEVNRTPVKVEWPAGIDGRAIANRIVADADEGLTVEERMKRVEDARARGETDRLIIWAGAGVGIVKEIKSTREVFNKVHIDAVTALRRISAMLG